MNKVPYSKKDKTQTEQKRGFTPQGVKKILLGITLVAIGMLIGYYGFMWFKYGFSIHFLDIDSCVKNGGIWDSVVNMCKR